VVSIELLPDSMRRGPDVIACRSVPFTKSTKEIALADAHIEQHHTNRYTDAHKLSSCTILLQYFLNNNLNTYHDWAASWRREESLGSVRGGAGGDGLPAQGVLRAILAVVGAHDEGVILRC
jgi:hypothetical protein